MSGIYVHAQILNTLLTQCWLRETPAWISYTVLVVIPILLAWLHMRLRALLGLLASLVCVVLLWTISVVAFSRGWWFPMLAPLVAVVVTTLGVEGYHFFRSHLLLGRFVAPEVADAMLGIPTPGMAQEEREVTIIFSDIRGYTTLSETMAPSDMVELLNEYHSRTLEIYQKHGGRCLSYYGDAQMILYGAPARKEDHAMAAVRAACEVQAVLLDLAERWKKRNLESFEVGIGICTGKVYMGLVGSQEHMEYTAIGDAVNTASRLQGLSRELDSPILASESTVLLAGARVAAEPLKAVALKGKAQSVMTYRILGFRP